MVIKLDESDNKHPVIVFFHENRKSDFSSKACAVLLDDAEDLGSYFRAAYTVQRGFIQFTIKSTVKEIYKDYALVNFNDISQVFNQRISEVFERLSNIYGTDDEFVQITPPDAFSLSFLSFGYAVVNNVSLLIDVSAKTHSKADRRILFSIAGNLLAELPQFQKDNLKEALEMKYGDSYDNKLYLAIIGAL